MWDSESFSTQSFSPVSWDFGSVTTAEVSGGKGDNDGRKKRHIVKPTGLLTRKNVKIAKLEQEQREVVAEVVQSLSKSSELRDETEIVQMSLAELNFEIKTLLHKQFRTQEDEAMLLILLAANI